MEFQRKPEHTGHLTNTARQSRNNNNFSVTTTYESLVGQHQTHIAFKWLWRSSCQPKHKVFFWLLLKDRLSTRYILRRKNMILESYSSVFCQNDVEKTRDHLFLNCPFAIVCWGLHGIDFTPKIFSQK
jgi:hypothetical protein